MEAMIRGAGSAVEELDLRGLAPYDTIHVRTRSSEYRMVLLDPVSGRALVQGGDRFPEATPVAVIGARSGHRSFDAGRISVGCGLSLSAHGRLVVTSPIQSLRVSAGHPGSVRPESHRA
jgi:hypothetical protein